MTHWAGDLEPNVDPEVAVKGTCHRERLSAYVADYAGVERIDGVPFGS